MAGTYDELAVRESLDQVAESRHADSSANVDLRSSVAHGRFREDLFHRPNVVRVHVPPLRERKDDIVHLGRTAPLLRSGAPE